MVATTGQTQDTSAKIMQAAKELFAENGYDGVTIKRIAQLAGTTSALISYYFGGKAQLYQVVLKQQTEIFLSMMVRWKDTSLSPLQHIKRFMDAQARLHLADPHSIYMIYREFLTPTKTAADVVQERIIAIYEGLSGELEMAKAGHYINASVDCRRAAFTLLSIFALFILTCRYESLSDSSMLTGKDPFSRLQGVYLDYLQTLSTGKETLQ